MTFNKPVSGSQVSLAARVEKRRNLELYWLKDAKVPILVQMVVMGKVYSGGYDMATIAWMVAEKNLTVEEVEWLESFRSDVEKWMRQYYWMYQTKQQPEGMQDVSE